ncbi:GNAT family N-acetyltransferase [Comamonas testosteroni]|uniref:GNAT family N-acetyltransferase n=1 Tax=Comamonas testosteroni TaxID=285 RepID=A0A373FPD5_COMTE|nr:GNAT family N-acetyltransferase [Comamonas testosteroni]RGE46021.1 GNAT family N-acetyltransferase [Comamonas testosteroni]
MNISKDWLKAPWQAGSGWLRDMGKSHAAERRAPSLVPIRSLSPRHRERIVKHLLKLDARDRYLRFGYAASDEQVARYVEHLDFERDDIFGIFNRRLELIAMAHLAFAGHPEHEKCAEFGVSVLKSARGKGLGARLFERAVLHARSKNVSMMFIHALSENTAMLKIARNAGATVKRDGSESEAYLELPPADFETHVNELMTEHIGEMDYQLKKQANNFWAFLAGVQEVRKGVQEGRHQSAE